MEVVTYHYIRKYDKRLKYFRFLEFKNFKKQLDYFSKKKIFISKDIFKKIIEKKIKPPKKFNFTYI